MVERNIPKNGMYLTHEDFPQWQDMFSNLLNSDYKSKIDNPDLNVKDITFVVTEKCSLNCSYCYQKNKTQKTITKEIAKDAIDFILNDNKVNGYYDSNTAPGVILEFIGGEPLLEIELMDYIVEYFKFRAFELNHPWALNYMINISSNGIAYFNPEVQDFLKRNDGKVNLGITIDGNKELHDSCRKFPNGAPSYDIVEKAVKRHIEVYPNFSTKLTLAPSNIMYLYEALKNMWELGIQGAWTNCVFEEGWTLEDARIMYKEMIKLADYMLDSGIYYDCFTSLFDESIGVPLVEKRNWCGGNGQMLAIGTDGRCFPCIRFMDYSLTNNKELCIGNIWDGLDSIETNCELCKLKQVDMETQSDDKCKNCDIAQGCSICTAYNYDIFKDANHRATFICEMHHARVLANYYYFNKLYEKLGIDKKFELNVPQDMIEKITM